MMVKQLFNFHFLLAVLFSGVLVSCGDLFGFGGNQNYQPQIPQEGDSVRSTLLVYMMAENNLDRFSQYDIDEILMGAVDVPNDCNMFVFVDGVDNPVVLRFYANRGVATCDTIHRFENDFYSSDIREMENVFDFIFSRYPTRNLNLVLWSHGDGWVKFHPKTTKSRSIGFDNGENSAAGFPSKASIEAEQLAGLLSSLPMPVEMLMFDACFMQCIEVVYDLRKSAKWILASPAEIPANGAPYHKMVKEFLAKNINPESLMMSYANEYSEDLGVLLSVVDCGKVDAFADIMAELVPKYFPSDSTLDTSKYFSYLLKHNSYPEFFDIYGVAKTTFSPEDYSVWKEAFDELVVCSYAANAWETVYNYSYKYVTKKDLFGGVSMYLPMHDSKHSALNSDFRTLDWYSAAAWDIAGW